MTRINLLPWRDELKKQRTVEFYVILGVVAALGAATWYAGHWYYEGLISYHEHRNSILEDEISQLEQEIAEIDELDEQREQLLARMNVIEDLQAGRPQIVHLFEEVATSIPDGVYLESMEQNNDRISLSGVAESNARVSNYMEALDESPWLMDPDLDVIEVQEKGGARVSNFTLQVDQTTPDEGDGSDDGKATE